MHVGEPLDRQLYWLDLSVDRGGDFSPGHLWQSLQKLVMSAAMPLHT
jgi:hypothetical protein